METPSSYRTCRSSFSGNGQSILNHAVPPVADQFSQITPSDRADSTRNSSDSSTASSPNPGSFKLLLQAFLRNLQLLSLVFVNPWNRNQQEAPKVAISRSRALAVVRMSVHVLPLGTALCLICINLSTLYPKGKLPATALQFLAKGLELLTQASIANMSLFYLRCEMLGQEALPFGALFAGLQTTSISYLWSLEFIGSLTSSWFPSRRKWAFAVFTAFNIILAAGVGPSIAITLIPRDQNFPFGSQFLWFNGTEHELWPSQLNRSHVPASCYTTSWQEMMPDSSVECPWRALPTVLEMVKSGTFANLPSFKKMITGGKIQPLFITNQKFDASYGYTYFPVGPVENKNPFVSFLKQYSHDDNIKAVTATTKGLMQAFFISWAQISDGPRSAMPEVFKVASTSRIMRSYSKQALVWTTCQETSALLFGSPSVEFPGIQDNSSVHVPFIQQSSHWQLVWADTHSELPISIAAIIVPPAASLNMPSNITAPPNGFACTISASWAPSYLVISGAWLLNAESGITYIKAYAAAQPACSPLGSWNSTNGWIPLNLHPEHAGGS